MGSYATTCVRQNGLRIFFKDCAPRCLLRTFVKLLQQEGGVNSRKSAPKLRRGTGMHNPITIGKMRTRHQHDHEPGEGTTQNQPKLPAPTISRLGAAWCHSGPPPTQRTLGEMNAHSMREKGWRLP